MITSSHWRVWATAGPLPYALPQNRRASARPVIPRPIRRFAFAFRGKSQVEREIFRTERETYDAIRGFRDARRFDHGTPSVVACAGTLPALQWHATQDARALLKAAIRDPNPVMFFEHKFLYRRIKEDLPAEEFVVPLGRARTHRYLQCSGAF